MLFVSNNNNNNSTIRMKSELNSIATTVNVLEYLIVIISCVFPYFIFILLVFFLAFIFIL